MSQKKRPSEPGFVERAAAGQSSPQRRIPKLAAQQPNLAGVHRFVLGTPEQGPQLRPGERVRFQHRLI